MVTQEEETEVPVLSVFINLSQVLTFGKLIILKVSMMGAMNLA